VLLETSLAMLSLKHKTAQDPLILASIAEKILQISHIQPNINIHIIDLLLE
jgi:hypothetical protein